MTGEMDPGCRGAFPPDEEAWDRELLATCRALIALRHETPALRSVAFTPLAADGMAAAYRRGSGSGSVVVAINAGEEPATLTIDVDGMEEVAIPGLLPASVGSSSSFELPARSARVLRTA